jgi:hypothetical protein
MSNTPAQKQGMSRRTWYSPAVDVIFELLGGKGWVVWKECFGYWRFIMRPGKETQPGDRLCKATLNTSMHVNADATLVDVATAGMMPPASIFALKLAGEDKI